MVNSFSKYFSMTGWRIGWLVVPEALVRPIERLTQNLYISPPASSQEAAISAFDGIEELEAIKQGYARNRAMLLEELPRAGLGSILPADGAFYLYAEVTRFTGDSEAFAKSMLREIGVAITPGIDFDPEHGRDLCPLLLRGPRKRDAQGRAAHQVLAKGQMRKRRDWRFPFELYRRHQPRRGGPEGCSTSAGGLTAGCGAGSSLANGPPLKSDSVSRRAGFGVSRAKLSSLRDLDSRDSPL